jgi:carboxypeptidase family protein
MSTRAMLVRSLPDRMLPNRTSLNRISLNRTTLNSGLNNSVNKVLRAVLLCSTLLGVAMLWAQTTTTGELGGTVTDPSGAVVTNAAVTFKNADTGATATVKTNSTGYYKFPYLQPGNYKLEVIARGFQTVERTTIVNLGASVTTNFQLALSSGQTTVEVSGQAAAIETEDANVTANFNARSLELLPNPGNDLSAVALTSPGVVMNTAGGAMFGGGNFSVNGLPATSNLFTLDGSNDNDPFFNVNNSGATNLSLGLNDVQESTVVSNGYSGSYGGLAGANVNFVSKSGTNAFHGNAIYWWNGDVLDANNYFRNQNGTPRPFVNANQFAGSIGGPIKKDKAFFFFDVEGLNLAIPAPTSVNLPTPAFQNAVIDNLNATGLAASVPFYQTMFGLYNRLSQAGGQQLGAGTDPNNGATTGGGCSDVSPSTSPAFAAFATAPCAVKIQAGLQAHTHDRLFVGRYDQNFGLNDKLFIRVEKEHGLQASYTDPIDPAFNAISDQPQWQSQLSETHTFGADKMNDFKASLLWYSAGFTMQNPQGEIAALPITPSSTATVELNDGSLSALNALGFLFPQGRNITQYQVVDDFSWVRGRHNFKVGANFRRDDISDYNATVENTPVVVDFTLGDFANGGAGGANLIAQTFPTNKDVPIALYQLGLYAADDVRVSSSLKLTLSLRMDHLSNPVCQDNCFQRFAPGEFANNTSAPVNQAIQSGLNTAFPSVTSWVAQPKIGFAWSPRGSQKTVIRGGIGIFSDALPTGAIDSFVQNAPLDPGFNTFGGYISPAQTGNLGTCTGSCTLYQLSSAADASFRANYASGGAVSAFNFTNATAVKVPTYYKWSLEVQQSLGWNTTLSTMYVGNHGSHEEISNSALNAYSPTPFADLPTTIPDGRFGEVTQVQNVANSNYAGLTMTLNHGFRGGLQFQSSYTWSHALDDISNNSLSPFGLNTTGLYADVVLPQDPQNIGKYNYGNSDYDIRHSFLMSYVWSDAFRHLTSAGPNALMKGWTFSGTIITHTGLPFTVYSSNVTSDLQQTNYGGGTQYVFADVSGPSTSSCGASAALVTSSGLASDPCLLASNFADPTDNWGQQRRNQYRGPNYFDTDFAVEKAFGLPKWESAHFSVGARFFNLFNHPNFGFPVMNLDNTSNFGQILQTTGSPTSIYGSGLGADSSPRIIQLQAKFVF